MGIKTLAKTYETNENIHKYIKTLPPKILELLPRKNSIMHTVSRARRETTDKKAETNPELIKSIKEWEFF